jgi:hypothetical protein
MKDMTLNESLAYSVAMAYAESPQSNKSDPQAFGIAVRTVFETVQQNIVNSTQPKEIKK